MDCDVAHENTNLYLFQRKVYLATLLIFFSRFEIRLTTKKALKMKNLSVILINELDHIQIN